MNESNDYKTLRSAIFNFISIIKGDSIPKFQRLNGQTTLVYNNEREYDLESTEEFIIKI